MDSLIIRPEEPGDYEAIDWAVKDAFKRDEEAALVRSLRQSSGYESKYSLVAVMNGKICGHVMLSRINLVDGSEKHEVLCLAPLSVTPESQGKGIGTKLVEEAIKLARENNEVAITVEGNPKYYGRFGFMTDENVVFDLPDWAPKDAGRIIFLTDKRPTGKVGYPEIFKVVE